MHLSFSKTWMRLCAGALLLFALLFFGQWLLLASGVHVAEDGSWIFYEAPRLPPVVVGLIAALGLALLGAVRTGRTALEWLPTLVVGTVVILAGKQPLLLGEYVKGSQFRLPLLFWTQLALALVGALLALIRKQGRGFRWREALWPALGILGACAMTTLYALERKWLSGLGMLGQSAMRPQIIQAVIALYLAAFLTGVTLLPYLRVRGKPQRAALIAVGGAYLIAYAILYAQGGSGRLVAYGFLLPTWICLPAGLLLAGLLPGRRLDKPAKMS